jgi:hypothetical protein
MTILHQKQRAAAQRHLRTGELATVEGCLGVAATEDAEKRLRTFRVADEWPESGSGRRRLRGRPVRSPRTFNGPGTRGAARIYGGGRRCSGGFSQRR